MAPPGRNETMPGGKKETEKKGGKRKKGKEKEKTEK